MDYYKAMKESPKQSPERLRRMAERMKLQGNMGGTEMVSGRVVKKSPLEMLAKGIQGGMGSYYDAKADALESEQKSAKEAAMRQFILGGGDPSQGGVPQGGAPQAPAGDPMLAQLYSIDPSAAMKYKIDQMSPTDRMKEANWMGMSPQQIRAMEINKGYGGAIKEGMSPQVDQQGNVYASPVQMTGGGTVDQYRTGLEDQRNRNIEAAKAGFDMITVETKDGPVMMTRDQAVNMASPNRNDMINAAGDSRNQMIRQNSDVSSISPQLSYDGSLQGQGQQAQPVGGIPLKQPPNPNDELLNKDFVSNSYRPTMEQAQGAAQANARLEALRNIDLTGNTGWGTETAASAASVLTGLGFGGEEARKLASDAQTFKSVVSKQVNEELMLQKGPQTEGDAQRAFNIQAQLGNTPEANAFIIDMSQALNDQKIAKAQFFAQSANKGYPLEAEWQQMQKSIFDHPNMQKYRNIQENQTAQQAVSGGITPQEEQELLELRKLYGR